MNAPLQKYISHKQNHIVTRHSHKHEEDFLY